MRSSIVPQDVISPRSRWIGLGDWRHDALPVEDHPYEFTGRFSAPIAVDGVTLRIGSTLRYIVLLNGQFVHEGPARSLPGEVYVDELHVPLVGPRAACHIAVLMLPPTGATACHVHDRVGLIAEVASPAPGPQTLLVTDASWRVRKHEGVRFHNGLCSLPTTQQEHWQARVARQLSRDDAGRAMTGGDPARVLGPAGVPPWRITLRRDCPVLTHAPIAPRVVYGGRDGCAKDPACLGLARAFNAREVRPVPLPQDVQTWTLDEHLNVLTFDAGRTRLLRPVVDVLTSSPQTRLEIYYDIGLVGRPSASLGFASDREGFVDSLENDGDPCLWRPIGPRGARYVTVRFAGSGRCTLRVHLESVDYPFGPAVERTFADPELDQIWSRSVSTLRSSTTDVFVDTCWRENMLWTFDAAVIGKAAFVAFRDATQWRRSLGLIARWAEANAPWPTSVVPAGNSGVILPDQSFSAIISLGEFAELTGERRFATDAVERFASFLQACEGQLTPENLFVPPSWSWHWIDWAPLDRRPVSLPVNLLLLLACEAAVKLTEGMPASRIRPIAISIGERIRAASEAFWDEAAGLYRDHVEPARPIDAGQPVVPMAFAERSAHANALALRARLGGSRRCARVAGNLAGSIASLPFSPGWVEIVLGALFDHGEGAAAVRELRRLYRPWLDRDQPTWSEGFGQVEFNTAHGWGASALPVLNRLRKPPHPAGVE